MSIQVKIIAWLLSVVSVLGVLYGAYHYGRHVQSLTDADAQNAAVIAQQIESAKQLSSHIEKEKKAVEDHDQNQTIIDSLRSELGRVRVRVPSCTVPAITESIPDKNGRSRALPESTQIAFDEFRQGLESDAARCDAMNIDAIRLNSEIK